VTFIRSSTFERYLCAIA